MLMTHLSPLEKVKPRRRSLDCSPPNLPPWWLFSRAGIQLMARSSVDLVPPPSNEDAGGYYMVGDRMKPN